MESGAFVCLVLAVLSWQGLSQGDDEPESNTGNNGMRCRRADSISLIILTEITKKPMENDLVIVRVQRCESSWTDICDGVWSWQNISHCNPKAVQSLTAERILCKDFFVTDEILECLQPEEDCKLSCLAYAIASFMITFNDWRTMCTAVESDTSTPIMKMTPGTSTLLTTRATNAESGTMSESTIFTERSTTFDMTSGPTTLSNVEGTFIENNLIAIIGGPIVAVLVGIIIVLIILLVALFYRNYHKRENLLIARYNSSNATYSDDTLQRYTLHQPESLESTLQEGHHETEPYYESLEQPHKQHDIVQPAEYEEFQPSSTTTTTSQLPLLKQDTELYEVTGEGAGHTNGVYETVHDPVKFTSQHQDTEDSPDNHVYYILEPHV